MYKNLYMLALLCLVSLDTKASDTSSTKICSYNICTLHTTYGTSLDIKYRMPRILKQISTIDADIVCLQEARKVEAEILNEQLGKMGYATILSSVNDTNLAATLITAYKSNKFIPDEAKCWWYNDQNPNIFGPNAWYKWGRILTAVSLHKLKDGVKDETCGSLTVGNTHLGLARDEKTFSIQLALKLLEERFKGQKIVWCGDFNFFADDGGTEHRKLITDAGYKDTLENLTDMQGNHLSGTFVGYSIDNYTPKSKDVLSRLDGIFAKNLPAANAQCLLSINLAPDLSNRDELPSDHFPVITEVELR